MSKIWKSSAGFSFFTLISRIFGYVRDLVLTSLLGASSAHDIFVVIFRIPNVFRSFFGEGALAQSLVPSIIEAKENLNSFLNQVFSLLFITLLTFVVLAETFPDIFISLFAPGFYDDPDKLKSASDIELTVNNVLYNYQRAGDPQPVGFGSMDYIITNWKRQ